MFLIVHERSLDHFNSWERGLATTVATVPVVLNIRCLEQATKEGHHLCGKMRAISAHMQSLTPLPMVIWSPPVSHAGMSSGQFQKREKHSCLKQCKVCSLEPSQSHHFVLIQVKLIHSPQATRCHDSKVQPPSTKAV